MLSLENCPISDFPAKIERSGDKIKVSDNAIGIDYVISISAEAEVNGKYKWIKFAIASWIVARFLSGDQNPSLDTNTLAKISSDAYDSSLTVNEKFNRLMLVFGRLAGKENKAIILSEGYNSAQEMNSIEKTKKIICSWTDSTKFQDLNYLIEHAKTKDYIKEFMSNFTLKFEGWQFIEENNRKKKAISQAFVAMWFDDTMQEAYENAIRPAIEEMGYTSQRIDLHQHINKIDDEIISEIRRSRFIIADFTCGLVQGDDGIKHYIPRGGVYYEAGFAQGLGIPVIWTCKEDQINQVHFDTRQYNHLLWSDVEKFKQDLKNRIGAVIGDGPLKQ